MQNISVAKPMQKISLEISRLSLSLASAIRPVDHKIFPSVTLWVGDL